MVNLRNWTAKDLNKFLEDYDFIQGHIQGSHCFMNGKIGGKQRVVQVIFSSKERDCQSLKTMKIAIRHSGIPAKYFDEWRVARTIHREIIG
jgi:predicted RNA binding protein YcfA (HicA-like mRNA interferase family)